MSGGISSNPQLAPEAANSAMAQLSVAVETFEKLILLLKVQKW